MVKRRMGWKAGLQVWSRAWEKRAKSWAVSVVEETMGGGRKSGCVEINLPGNSRLIGVGRVRGKNSWLWFSIVRIRVQTAGTSISSLPCTARIVHASASSGNYWNVCIRVCVLFASFSLLLAWKILSRGFHNLNKRQFTLLLSSFTDTVCRESTCK